MSSIVISGDTSGSITLEAPAIAGTNTLTLTAATGNLSPLVSATAVASTSGTSIDFTSIPSWVKRITVMFSNVSTNGTADLGIRVGTGVTPTYLTSGYVATGGGYTNADVTRASAFTTLFPLSSSVSAANIINGVFILTKLSSTIWAGIGNFSVSSTIGNSAGTVTIGSDITAIRVTTTNGTDTFDAGSINILYE